ncbi:endonuclease/exonuclease/phosphatase family protein [Microbacterium sp. NPDC056234]|uniref:endonuclease/exonuclease/phosphatase family protein n=1 Tax=Microbacterium sp. NPDC056234 TaxID=3345757 RepID=UPI0035DCEEA7
MRSARPNSSAETDRDLTDSSLAERTPSTRHGLRLTGFLLTLLLGIPVLLLLAWPQALGAQRAPVIAQLIAFRAPLALGLAVLAITAAVIARLRRRWAVAAAVALVLASTAVLNGAVLMHRGGDASGKLPEGDLTVLVWNTQGGAAPPADVADLVVEVGADIVSLPETDAEATAEIVRLLAARAVRMTPGTVHSNNEYSWIPTSVLIAEELGEYSPDPDAGSTPGLPSGVWRPVDGEGPTIVAAHTSPPLPGSMDDWDAGLRWIADACDATDTIVAGDLNATVDHLAGLGVDDALVGRCDDAPTGTTAGPAGTWPADAPAWIGARIDHVLVGRSWTVRRTTTVPSTDGGSDHRAVVAVLDAR